MGWYFWVGIIAVILIAIFSMPQLIKTVKTRSTVGVSLAMFIIITVGDFLFILNAIGILADADAIPDTAKRISAGLPLLLANAVSCISCGIVLFFKARNLRWAKKFGVSEKVLCDNYDTYYSKVKLEKIEKKAKKQASKGCVTETTTTEDVPPVTVGA